MNVNWNKFIVLLATDYSSFAVPLVLFIKNFVVEFIYLINLPSSVDQINR